MIDYTILTVISITALMIAIILFGMVISLSNGVDALNHRLQYLDLYTDTLADEINKQRKDFNRSLLVTEQKEKELDERINLLQCRLNQDRMQGIINGKITD